MKLTSNAIIAILIGALLGGALWMFLSIQNQKSEIKRLRDNYMNSLSVLEDYDQKRYAEFTLRNNKELMDILNINQQQIQDIKNKLIESNINIKNISKIVATDIKARDTVINVIDIDSLAYKIKTLQTFKIPFQDSTKCFYYKMELVYDNGRTEVHVLDRKFNDFSYDITTWERRRWKLFGIIPTRIFGRKIYKVKFISNCSETKTLILNSK